MMMRVEPALCSQVRKYAKRMSRVANQEKKRKAVEALQDDSFGGSGDAGALVPYVSSTELCSPENAVAFAIKQPTFVDSMFQVTFKGKSHPNKKRNHLTQRGQLVTAIRRITSQAAANSFGTAILADVDGKVVNQCERILGACCVASFSAFHRCMESELSEQWSRVRRIGFATHAYSHLITLVRFVRLVKKWGPGRVRRVP